MARQTIPTLLLAFLAVAMGEKTPEDKKMEEELSDFYRTHAPGKVQSSTDISTILTNFVGTGKMYPTKRHMAIDLKKKYGVAPVGWLEEGHVVKNVDVEEENRLVADLATFYKKHAPEKVKSKELVRNIVNQFIGEGKTYATKAQMAVDLKKKYGEAPAGWLEPKASTDAELFKKRKDVFETDFTDLVEDISKEAFRAPQKTKKTKSGLGKKETPLAELETGAKLQQMGSHKIQEGLEKLKKSRAMAQTNVPSGLSELQRELDDAAALPGLEEGDIQLAQKQMKEMTGDPNSWGQYAIYAWGENVDPTDGISGFKVYGAPNFDRIKLTCTMDPEAHGVGTLRSKNRFGTKCCNDMYKYGLRTANRDPAEQFNCFPPLGKSETGYYDDMTSIAGFLGGNFSEWEQSETCDAFGVPGNKTMPKWECIKAKCAASRWTKYKFMLKIAHLTCKMKMGWQSPAQVEKGMAQEGYFYKRPATYEEAAGICKTNPTAASVNCYGIPAYPPHGPPVWYNKLTYSEYPKSFAEQPSCCAALPLTPGCHCFPIPKCCLVKMAAFEPTTSDPDCDCSMMVYDPSQGGQGGQGDKEAMCMVECSGFGACETKAMCHLAGCPQCSGGGGPEETM